MLLLQVCVSLVARLGDDGVPPCRHHCRSLSTLSFCACVLHAPPQIWAATERAQRCADRDGRAESQRELRGHRASGAADQRAARAGGVMFVQCRVLVLGRPRRGRGEECGPVAPTPLTPRFNVGGDGTGKKRVGETGQMNGKGFYPERPNFETGGAGEA